MAFSKAAIPSAARRELALRYGCEPGWKIAANCLYCGAQGKVHWFKRSDGRPSYWVAFAGLEMDHFHPERWGGGHDQLVLACRRCNRSKRDRDPDEFIASLGRR